MSDSVTILQDALSEWRERCRAPGVGWPLWTLGRDEDGAVARLRAGLHTAARSHTDT